MHLPTAFLVVVSLTTANAHFLLNYPQTRGFDEDKEPKFCGGFPLSNNRSQFPLSGGFVAITSKHPKSDVNVLISFDANPTKFANFNSTSMGNAIPFLVPFTQMNTQGEACFPVNISSLGVPEAKSGVNATIQVQFDGGDNKLFQCADVTLSDTFTVPSGTKCENATGAFPATSTTGTGSSSPASNTSSPVSGGSPPPNGAARQFVPMAVAGCFSVLAALSMLAV